MRKLIVPICLGLLCLSFTLIPVNQTSSGINKSIVSTDDSCAAVVSDISSSVYTSASLQEHGLSKEAFNYAWKGYQKLLKKNSIAQSAFLTICDFSQSSRKKRLYIIDVENRQLITNTYVAHGRNSGMEYASRFSNRPESLQSSLGFYTTDITYNGQHGLSLRMKGLEPGFNDKAFQRAIVIHGADYIGDDRLHTNSYMGRSYGCPALPQNESSVIINTIKNGSCFFIYHPSRNYLLRSKLLNG